MSAMRDMFRRAVLTECTISDLMNGLLRVFAPFPKQHRPSHILRDHRQESARMPESSRFLVLSSRYTTVMTMHRLIRTGAVNGHLPRRALSDVEEWRQRHEAELLTAWEQAQVGIPPIKIEPRSNRPLSNPLVMLQPQPLQVHRLVNALQLGRHLHAEPAR